MDTLSTTQTQALKLLIEGKTHQETADILGVSSKTIQRWVKQPTFSESLEALRSTALNEISDDVGNELKRLVPKSLAVIEQFLDNPGAKGSDRLRAASIIGSWSGLDNLPLQEQKIQASVEQELTTMLKLLEQCLPTDTYKIILNVIASSNN